MSGNTLNPHGSGRPDGWRRLRLTPWMAVAMGLTLLIAWVMLRCAWINDDAYISFRVVDNLHHGYGLRWNVSERVWVFTNPLMTLSLAAIYPLTGELYLTSLVFSLAAAVAAVVIVVMFLSPRAVGMFAVAALLAGSKAFIDYSTSGLENCLSYLLVVLFYALALLGKRDTNQRFFWATFIAGLSLLNRMDTILIELPLLAWMFWRQRSTLRLSLFALGMTPFLAWEFFALAYYGTLIPNTAYAKLAAGIPTGIRLLHGVAYFVHSLISDPITLPSIAVILVLTLRHGKRPHVLAAVGVLAYLAYALFANDFMSGRFFAVPMLCAATLLSVLERQGLLRCSRMAALAILGIVLMSALHPLSPLRSNSDYGLGKTAWQHPSRGYGIGDERAYYYPGTGLLRHNGIATEPQNVWRRIGEELRDSPTRIHAVGSIGFRGFFAGPSVHIVDYLGLADPLLARLPARLDQAVWPGHYARLVPPGYIETIQEGQDRFADPRISRLYEDIHWVVSQPIWSTRRWLAIWRLISGSDRRSIDRSYYQIETEAACMRRMAEPLHRLFRELFSG